MRVLASLLALPASALLALGCDGGRPLDPLTSSASLAMSGSQLAAPSSMTAAATETGVDVSWQDNSANETGFEVHRSTTGATGTFTLLTTTAANIVAAGDQGLAPGTQYCYRVRAVRGTGSKATYSAFSTIACATPALAAPSNTSAAAASQTETKVTWQDNSGSETGFEIQDYSARLALTPANTTAYAHTGLSANSSHCYRIRTFRATGNDTSYSAFSNTACAVTLNAPPAPVADIVAAPNSSNGAVVSWNRSYNAASYGVYHSIDGGALWSLIGTVTSSYSQLSFQDYPLASEQAVCYRVVASNEMGDAPPSNTACVTPLAAPSNLVATALDAQTLELTWSDNSAVEDGYQVVLYVQRSTTTCYPPGYQGATDAGGIEYETIVAELPANATSFRATAYTDNCDPPTTYLYYVYAKKDGGRSSPSNEVDAIITSNP